MLNYKAEFRLVLDCFDDTTNFSDRIFACSPIFTEEIDMLLLRNFLTPIHNYQAVFFFLL